MSRITVSADHRSFEKDGHRHFIMADTCWSAFTNMTMEEWERYLSIRAEQGFNAVQIDVLPQWDRGIAPGEQMVPFLPEGKSELALSDIPEAYFEHIEAFLSRMPKYRMTPILVLLWSNYTKGTFFDHLWGKLPMKEEDVVPYVKKVASLSRPYEPLYFVSGDTVFSDQTVDDYYLPALLALKETDPEALASLHICGAGYTSTEEIEQMIPARLLYHEELDFYTFQSGHFQNWLERCTWCAEGFRGLKVTKPLFNSEPCYEGWETGTTSHDRAHLRRTTWASILTGADAGLTYGAQGIWEWYHRGDFFAPHDVKDTELLYQSEQPFTAWECMDFKGVYDRLFAKAVMERFGLYHVEPDHRFEAETEYTKMASANDGNVLLLYIPRNQKTKVHVPLDGRRTVLFDLTERMERTALITEDESGFILDYPGVNGDCLLVVYRQ